MEALYGKLQQEAFSGHSGTNELEILLVISWQLFGVAICQRLKQKGEIQEFLILILPQIILFISPHLWRLLYPAACILLLLLSSSTNYAEDKKPSQLPFLTNSRASIMLMCTLGILAVDFSAFPRRFAKTEAFGTSLMDVGVGCVVASMGITAARLYDDKVKPGIYTVMKSTIPLLFLGVMRAGLVNITEYGVHWNFFITLGLLPMSQSFLYRFISVKRSFYAGIFIGILHQLFLSGGLQDWVLSEDPRIGLIAMNKEGLISLPGYLSLTLLSVAAGYDFFTLEPSFTTFKRLGLASSLYIILTRWFDLLPSRRLANFSFILGSYSLTLLPIQGFRFLDRYNIQVPSIMKAISQNQLAYFLVGNLTTGLINMTCHTLLQPYSKAFIILVSYMAFLSLFSLSLLRFNLRLRLS